MCEQDIEARRARDLERYHRRTEQRVAQGLCPKCGKTAANAPTANCASRAARRRIEPAAPATPGSGRPGCRAGTPSAPAARPKRAAPRACAPSAAQRQRWRARASCEPCLEKRRAGDRASYAAGKAAGLKYGGANAEAKRRSGRLKSKRRQKARREAGLCIRCGKQPPVEGGTTCAPCRDRRQAAERRQYEERRADGLCTRCGGTGPRRAVALWPLRPSLRRPANARSARTRAPGSSMGTPLPPRLVEEIERAFERLSLVARQLLSIESRKQVQVKAGRQALDRRSSSGAAAPAMIANPNRVHRIGVDDATLLATEVFYRDFRKPP